MKSVICVLLLLSVCLLQEAAGFRKDGGLLLRSDDDEEYDRERREHREEEEDEKKHSKHGHLHREFILDDPVEISRTEAGQIRVLPGPSQKAQSVLAANNIGVSLLTMEPKALLIPQYMDASGILYVFKGKMRLSWVEDNKLFQQDLIEGDIFSIPGGTVFYILNTDEAQRLKVFGMLDISESLERGCFQSLFIGGGADPSTILSGFDTDVLAASFDVSSEEIRDLLGSYRSGPIVYTTDREYAKLISTNGATSKEKPFNLLKKEHAFKNKNGWTIAVDGEEYGPLRIADLGVFAVSLNPSAILAPHWNPRAAELFIVTKGEGIIQISYPNGSKALNKHVKEGSIFFVPRYFPMCQIATREGPFEFVGFSTSSRSNRPQFLAGQRSVLKAVDVDVLSLSFGAADEEVKKIVDSQKESIIVAGFIEE